MVSKLYRPGLTPAKRQEIEQRDGKGRRARPINGDYEVTDRLVVNLVSKTSCKPLDTCWALEACKGDISEAWVRHGKTTLVAKAKAES
jgi:hypothetical protein